VTGTDTLGAEEREHSIRQAKSNDDNSPMESFWGKRGAGQVDHFRGIRAHAEQTYQGFIEILRARDAIEHPK
jgi:hypothetical protein